MDNDYLVASSHLDPEFSFNATKGTSHYRKFSEKIKTIGVWDDHDFGVDNGGKEFAQKDKIRKLWLDFIDEPSDSERRTQVRSTIHQDYFFTKKVNGLDIKVHIILLDNRYEFDKTVDDRLGDDQWKWLDLALKRSV